MKSNSQSTEAQNVVAVRGLTKVFKDIWGRPKARAVDGVDFEIRRGEVFGLLGPNGSGKSTTIKILLGLLYQTSGYVEVLGRSPRDIATKERIGYLPEESYLYRYLTAVETLNFYGHVFALNPDDRRLRTEQLLEMVGLKGTGTRRVGEFSKGMQRRLGLAQALINDPELIILDEPTAGLDPVGCREVKDVIQTLARRGKTILLSSHLLADVEDVCDRVVIYYGGRIQSSGPLHELLARPDSLRFTTPALSRPLVEEVLAVMRREAAPDAVRVETPTQNLESYFISVVNRARANAQSTSGATAGNRVAAYLQPTEIAATAGEKVLERLAAVAPTPGNPETVVPGEPKPDETKLAALTQAEAPSVPAIQEPAPASEDSEALKEAEDKLSSFLNPPKS
ncbi:MAG: ABC transporter ATP-binding protein [Verrucomicrobiae bacterium]|nr:ABC transporter ATP-binding protein [Verrucomicrobiae bacterium]